MYSLLLHYKLKHEKVWECVAAPLHSSGGICAGGSCPRWQFSGWQLCWVAVALGGSSSWWRLS